MADLNGDGILDITTVGASGSSSATTVFLGRGNGTFSAGVSYVTSSSSLYTVQSADVNGDGIPDLVAAGWNGSSQAQLSVRLGTGNGSFGAATTYAGGGTILYGLALADFNGDGVLDIATTGESTGGGQLSIRLGTGNGSFGGATTYAAEFERSSDVAVGDFNRDGVLDVVTIGYEDGGDAYATVL